MTKPETEWAPIKTEVAVKLEKNTRVVVVVAREKKTGIRRTERRSSGVLLLFNEVTCSPRSNGSAPRASIIKIRKRRGRPEIERAPVWAVHRPRFELRVDCLSLRFF